jgi:uncharacterized protein (DUF1778 family)
MRQSSLAIFAPDRSFKMCIAKRSTIIYRPPILEKTLMSRSTERKDHPLSMRLPEADIAIIDRAAGLRGRSRTDFVREAAVRAAEEIVMEASLIRMSPAGFKAFLAALSGPAKPVPEMVEVLKRPSPWEKQGSHNRG